MYNSRTLSNSRQLHVRFFSKLVITKFLNLLFVTVFDVLLLLLSVIGLLQNTTKTNSNYILNIFAHKLSFYSN